LVAFLEQETFAFFIPGFPLQSGLEKVSGFRFQVGQKPKT
jgi:hypothetical protein